MSAVKHVLIVAPSWVGDMVMAQVLFRLLKSDNQSSIQISVLAPSYLRPLCEQMVEISEFIESPFQHGELSLVKRWLLANKLRVKNYDQAIVLPNSLKSALIPFLAGIPTRTGFVGECRYGLLNDYRKLDKSILPQMIQRFAALAFPKHEQNKLPTVLPMPSLSIAASQQDLLRTKFARYSLAPHAIAFCPGAEYGPAKRWPTSHFASLADRGIEYGYQIWIIGSEKEQPLAQEIISMSNHQAKNNIINFCGQTKLDEAIILLSLATSVVTNDSGLMHIAAALSKNMVVIYGSSSPGFTPPLSSRARIMQEPLGCSPCFERNCPLGHTACLVQISPDRVFKRLALERLTP